MKGNSKNNRANIIKLVKEKIVSKDVFWNKTNSRMYFEAPIKVNERLFIGNKGNKTNWLANSKRIDVKIAIFLNFLMLNS